MVISQLATNYVIRLMLPLLIGARENAPNLLRNNTNEPEAKYNDN